MFATLTSASVTLLLQITVSVNTPLEVNSEEKLYQSVVFQKKTEHFHNHIEFLIGGFGRVILYSFVQA